MNTHEDRLNQIKERFKLNNPELAKIAGVSKQAVGGWINNGIKPGTKAAVQIREKLGVRVEWLIDGDGPMLASSKEDEFVSSMEGLSPYMSAEAKQTLVSLARQMADKGHAPLE